MYPEIVIPGCLDNVVAEHRMSTAFADKYSLDLLEAFIVACAIETHVATPEVIPDVRELSIQLLGALAWSALSINDANLATESHVLTISDFIAEAHKRIFGAHITPPIGVVPR